MKQSQTKPFPVPCAAWANRLAALHPDDLTSDEQAALKHHLANCSACAAVYAAYQQIDARILSLPLVQPSAQQIARVEALITDQIAHSHEREITTLAEYPLSPARVPKRLARVERRVSVLAALLVVIVLIASAFALFSLRHAPSSGASTAHSTLYSVSYTGTVYAIEPGSGRIIWNTPLQMKPDEQFLVSGGTIFLASSCVSSTCDLYALRAADGHVLWQRSYKSLLGKTGASALSQYLASDGKALYIGSATGIYAWQASDGQQLWHHAPPSACLANPNGCFIDMETVSNGLVYVDFDGLYALNATDGTTRWFNLQALDTGVSPLVVTHNHVYVPNYGNSTAVHVLQANTGKLLDTPGLPRGTSGEIITDGSVVYICIIPAAGGSADIYALRSSDDHLLWHQHYTQVVKLDTVSAGSLYYDYLAASTSAPTLPQKSSVVTPSSSLRRGTLVANPFHVCTARTKNGSLQWCQSLPAGVLTSTAASQGIIYVPGFSQGLEAMRLSDGKILWQILAQISLDDADTVLV